MKETIMGKLTEAEIAEYSKDEGALLGFFRAALIDITKPGRASFSRDRR